MCHLSSFKLKERSGIVQHKVLKCFGSLDYSMCCCGLGLSVGTLVALFKLCLVSSLFFMSCNGHNGGSGISVTENSVNQSLMLSHSACSHDWFGKGLACCNHLAH